MTRCTFTRRLLGLLTVATALTLSAVAPALAATRSGLATITLPGTLTPLRHGTSATPFGVVVPTDARCPGDTAHDAYHVYSYLLPASTPLADVSFRTGVPSTGYGLFAFGAYYGAVNTALGTGQLPDLPASFSWSRLTAAQLLPHGTSWQTGILCANGAGRPTNYWAAGVRLSADGHGWSWTVTTPAATGSSSLWPILAPVLTAAVLAGGWLRLTRPRRARP